MVDLSSYLCNYFCWLWLGEGEMWRQLQSRRLILCRLATTWLKESSLMEVEVINHFKWRTTCHTNHWCKSSSRSILWRLSTTWRRAASLLTGGKFFFQLFGHIFIAPSNRVHDSPTNRVKRSFGSTNPIVSIVSGLAGPYAPLVLKAAKIFCKITGPGIFCWKYTFLEVLGPSSKMFEKQITV